MSRWLSVADAGLLALAPLASYASSASSEVASPPADCTLVGGHILADDMNVAHLICRGPDGSATVTAVQALPASAPPDTEAPTQYFPLDESFGG